MKKGDLKQNIRNGLDDLIKPTSPLPPINQKNNKKVEAEEDKRETHCNYVMNVKYLSELKVIASRLNISAKKALSEALDDYFEKYKHLL